MECAHCCTSCRLDRIEELLVAMLSKADNERARENAHYRQILERLNTMANQIDTLRDALRDNTDAVSARIDALIAEIQATGDNTASAATLADLQAISDHLKQLGTNPANPVPDLEPRR
jgi:septal ring factor EnvC (AmiA/AmiB activator)